MKTISKNSNPGENVFRKISILLGVLVVLTICITQSHAATTVNPPEDFIAQTDTTTKKILPEELKKYVGEYVLQSETKTLEFKAFVEDGKFKVHPDGQSVGIMKYVGDHTFIHTRNADIRLVFQIEKGKAVGATLHQRGKQVSGKRKSQS